VPRKPSSTERAYHGEELPARYRQDSLGQTNAHLGQEGFERAYAKGMALRPDEALRLASGKSGRA
jgi:hypothetical protein